MRLTGCEEDLLRHLASMPFLDRLELAAVSGWGACGGAMLSLFRLALMIDGGLDILLGGNLQVPQDFQMSLWEG